MRAIGIHRLAAFYLVVAGGALVAIFAIDTPAQIIPPFDEPARWGLNLSLGVVTGLLVVLASRLATARLAWAAVLAEEFRLLLGPLNRREAFLAALLSGTAEELFFRGVLQPALGFWITAAIFGVLHIGPNRRFIPWTFMALAAGIIFGGLFVWTGNLLAPILAHIAINYLNLRYLTAPPPETEVRLAEC